jgi:ornithine carbamoyltransferase
MSSPIPQLRAAPGCHPTAAGMERGNSADLVALLCQALAMRARGDADPGRTMPLHGKNMALLCHGEPGEACELFIDAATALGARVARLTDDALSPGTRHAEAARVLGRLYDAIECQGLPSETVERLARQADVPVYAGLASADHATAALIPFLGMPPDEARKLVVQAALLATLDRG